MNDNISRGCATKTEFPEGRGGPFWESIFEKSRGEGGHRKNPFRGGGMDIFWNYTIYYDNIMTFICQYSHEKYQWSHSLYLLPMISQN